MYIAVISGNKVLEISSNESSSLEGMKAYAMLGYKKLTRFITNQNAYIRYSNGELLLVDVASSDNKNLKLVIAS